MARFNFDRLFYGFTRQRYGRRLGDPRDMMILSNMPKAYIRSFVDDGMVYHSSTIKWAMENQGACSWSEETKNYESLTPDEQGFIKFKKSYGANAGYTIALQRSSQRAIGAIALLARVGVSQDEVDEIWRKDGQVIELICNSMHLKLLTLPYASGRNLSDRQREVLEWAAEGKTTQDTASIMGITAATVEKHMRIARDKMGVETTTQAVFKAAIQNQIFTN